MSHAWRVAEPLDDMDAVLRALHAVRLRQAGWDEARIHSVIANALASAGIFAEHEARIGGRMRPDFLTAGGTVIELKKGRPPAKATLAQITRYAAHERVAGVILVSERGLPAVPNDLDGKPLAQVALYAAWGIAF